MRAFALALLLSPLVPAAAHARAGGGDSYDSGSSDSGSSGSSDSGSSWSSDSGSSWSSDSDWSSSTRSTGPSRPMSDAEAELLFILLVGCFSALAVYGVYQFIRDLLSGRLWQVPHAAQVSRAAVFQSVLDDIRRTDPDFDPQKFLDRVQAGFLKVQEAWSAADLAPVRPFLSDGVHERFRLLLDLHALEGIRNRMEQVRVSHASIVQAQLASHFHVLHVSVTASAVDTYVSTRDGTKVRGSGRAESFTEVWSFLRRPGARTKKAGGLFEGLCPSCGAPLRLADAAQCASCKAWAGSGEHDWVLAEITQACEWAPRGNEGAIRGFAELQAEDPGLNEQFLEDRASVAMWRWFLALAKDDADAIRPVATDGFWAELGRAKGGEWFRDPAVGSVDVLLVEQGEPNDRVHLLVKWSGKRMLRDGSQASEPAHRRSVLTFIRRHGTKTDVRTGLSSSRCAGCGAPVHEREACGFCGAVANDGSRHWVLSAMTPHEDWRRKLPSDAPAPPPAGPRFSPADAFAALVAAMAADRRADTREIEVLERFAKAHRIPAERAAELWKAARAGQLAVPAPASGAAGREVLAHIADICLADDVLTDTEQELLGAYAKGAGIDAQQLTALLGERRAALKAAAAQALKDAHGISTEARRASA